MGGLVGALVNDINLMKTKGALVCLLAAVIMPVVYLVSPNDTTHLVAQIVFFLAMPAFALNSTNVSFDAKWNHFERLWAVPPLAMIASRYIIYVVFTLVFAGLWMLLPLHDGNWRGVVNLVLIMVFTGALYYPIMFALYSDHNMGIVILMISGTVASVSLISLAGFLGRYPFGDEISGLLVVLVWGAYALSWVLSTGFYMIHMKRGV